MVDQVERRHRLAVAVLHVGYERGPEIVINGDSNGVVGLASHGYGC